MKTIITIGDLSVAKELGGKAMSAVRGGQADQANGTSQLNLQSMLAVANVGNGSLFAGPATIQSDNTFTQSASNYNYAENFKGLSIAIPVRAFDL